ncbi:DUF1648 domain-containing protein [Rhodococcus sp. OK302]|uniref:DUF1648 domain-containing protein n=1 Tax=Rhodococcus sp. OK302 TaxID=1882769 RepID=UPI000B9F243F|nr:DUF1648 domain-containing protein [Rhodococcus sp. OK302]OYD67371.1 hypothetical protein BDB13_0890 [Rhodococcus sp. OK302]
MKHRVVDPAGAIFGILIPALCAFGGVVLTKMWEHRLPEKIATHWTTTSPDGFSTPTANAWTVALLTLLFGGGLSAVAALAPAMLMMRRFMLVTGLGVVGLITTVNVALLYNQLDVVDPSTTSLPYWSIGVGALIGGALGYLGALTLRDYRVHEQASGNPSPDLPRSDAALPISDDVGFTTKGSAILALITLVPGVLLTLSLGSYWSLFMFAALALLLVSLVRFRATVDESGISVVNMGMRAMEYAADEVVDAKVAEIKPFTDFGGWGLKKKGRRNYGIVTRTGPAVVISFASGDRLTITTPRAEEMAGALNRLADARVP